MLLSIITLNYKKKELTIRCLKSLVKALGDEFENKKIEVIIVDNKSSDDSFEVIKDTIKDQKYKNITIFENSVNAGFGGGCNFGANRAKGKYLLFLNNDTVVHDKSILDMVDFMEKNQQVSVLGGELKNPNGTIQASVGKFYTPFNIILLLLGLQRVGLVDRNPSTRSEADWVKGALLMIRRDLFEKFGGFDSNIFMYTEDMELCYRIKKAGYRVYFQPGTNITHQEQGSSSRAFAIINIYKNLLYFYKKHRGKTEYNFVKFLLTAKARLLVFIGKQTKNSYLISTYEQALDAIR